MKTRCTQLLVGVALSAVTYVASAEVKTLYEEHFETSPQHPVVDLSKWTFPSGLTGAPVILHTNPTPPDAGQTPLASTGFLGEFGGTDQIHLTVPVASDIRSVRLTFDAYLLRTWDGIDPTAIPNARDNEPDKLGGPDRFDFGYNTTTRILGPDHDSFSNGGHDQTYCPGTTDATCEATFGSDPNQKDRLGFNAELPPLGPNGKAYSLVYHFDTGPIAYNQAQIVFDFLSSGLQIHTVDIPATPVIDESWGLDNVVVFGTTVPEPRTWILLAVGLVLSSLVAKRHVRVQR